MEHWQRNLYTVWFTQILSLTGFGFVLPFIPFFLQELGVTDPVELKQWVGWISAVPGISMGIAAPIWGALSDRYGRKLMMLRAMATGTIILAIMSTVHSPMSVLLLRLCQGFFTGTVTAAATLVAAGTPSDKLSSSLGLLASSTFIGYIIGPTIGGLSAEYLGYRVSFLIGSGVMLTSFILVLFLVREPKEGRKQRDKKEGKRGISAFGEAVRALPWQQIAPLLIILFLLRAARSMPTPFLPIQVQLLRGKVEGAAAIMGAISGVIGLVTAISGILLGKLGDRHPRLKLISIFALAASILVLPASVMNSIMGFTVFFVAGSFFAGGLEPLMQSHLTSLTSAENRGTLFGIQTTVGSLGWAISPLIGSVLSIHFSIPSVFVAMSGFLLLASFVARSNYKKRR